MNKPIDFSRFRISRMEEGEIIESFNCGDADLNDFILHEAPLYREALLAVSYVAKIDDEVIAYFSLANDRISLGDFESKTEFNRFRKHRFINEKRLKSYPAAKICRFVTVDAYIAAIPFYEKNHFSPLLPDDTDEHTRLLFYDLNDE